MEAILDFLANIPWWVWLLIFLLLVSIRDIFFQKAHTISHNFPIVATCAIGWKALDPRCANILWPTTVKSFPLTVLKGVGSMHLQKKKTTMRVLELIGIFTNTNTYL